MSREIEQRVIKFKQYYRWEIDFKSKTIDAKKGDIYINYGYLDCGSIPIDREKISPWCQYTGLKDCKRTAEYPEGQEIYEGDIVDRRNYGIGTVEYGTIKIQDNEMYGQNQIAGFFIKDKDYNCHMDDIKAVIGNIYENKDLLDE